jgi:transcriptional regulator GlxA family with amidase domain
MRQSFPAVTVEDRLHVVEDGHVLTSAGISAGIDMHCAGARFSVPNLACRLFQIEA